MNKIELRHSQIEFQEDSRQSNLQEANNILIKSSQYSFFSEWEDVEDDLELSRNYHKYKKK